MFLPAVESPDSHGRMKRRGSAVALIAAVLASIPLVAGCGDTQATSAPASNSSARAGSSGSADSATEERVSNAAQEVPASPKPSSTGAAGQNFQDVIASKGDVKVYAPIRAGAKLTVPVEIVNTGKDRALYEVDIRVEGSGGFRATGRVTTDVVGVYPGGSWPVEVEVSDAGKPVPENPQVTITRISRDEFK